MVCLFRMLTIDCSILTLKTWPPVFSLPIRYLSALISPVLQILKFGVEFTFAGGWLLAGFSNICAGLSKCNIQSTQLTTKSHLSRGYHHLTLLPSSDLTALSSELTRPRQADPCDLAKDLMWSCITSTHFMQYFRITYATVYHY